MKLPTSTASVTASPTVSNNALPNVELWSVELKNLCISVSSVVPPLMADNLIVILAPVATWLVAIPVVSNL